MRKLPTHPYRLIALTPITVCPNIVKSQYFSWIMHRGETYGKSATRTLTLAAVTRIALVRWNCLVRKVI
jgi:hypothetical protein